MQLHSISRYLRIPAAVLLTAGICVGAGGAFALSAHSEDRSILPLPNRWESSVCPYLDPGRPDAPEIRSVCALGLMDGTDPAAFSDRRTVSVGQALGAAVRLYERYRSLPLTEDDIRFVTKSAEDYGLLPDSLDFSPARPVLRCELAAMLAGVFPGGLLAPISRAVPLDFSGDRDFYPETLLLYQAGILPETDTAGAVFPFDPVSRSELAVILARMALPQLRQAPADPGISSLPEQTPDSLLMPEALSPEPMTLAQVLEKTVALYEHSHGIHDASQSWPGSPTRYALDRGASYGIFPAHLDLRNPGRLVQRQEAAALLASAAGDEELAAINEIASVPDYPRVMPVFPGETEPPAVPAVYLPQVLKLYEAGILTGLDRFGSFGPEDPVTQAEFSGMVRKIRHPELRVQFTPDPLPVIERMVYGRSGAGRELEAFRFGDGDNVAVFCFAIHGWEDSFPQDGMMLRETALRLCAILRDEYDDLIRDRNWSVYVLPTLNPDGLYDGIMHSGPGRCTTYIPDGKGGFAFGDGIGIDLNRSFPYNYISRSDRRNFNGNHPLSAKEALALADFVQEVKGPGKNYLVDTHGWFNQIIVSGAYGCDLHRCFSNHFGAGYYNLHGSSGYFSAWAAFDAGYDETCLFEFPYVGSAQQFRDWGYAEAYHDSVRDLLRTASITE